MSNRERFTGDEFTIGETVVFTAESGAWVAELCGSTGDIVSYNNGIYRVMSSLRGIAYWTSIPGSLVPIASWPKPEDDAVDMINHPPHYTGHPKGIECIDVIEDNPFYLISAAMKYLWRVSWGSKGADLEDLNKARWYITREIERREKADANG